MKKTIVMLMIAVMLTGMGTVFAQGAQEEGGAVELTLAHIYDPSHAWHKGAVKAAEVAKEMSDGRINITIYPAGQQGTEPEILEQAILGSLDIVAAGAGQVGSIYSPINVLEMPYTFRDNQHVLAFGQSEVGKELFEGFRKAHGARIIGPSSYGIRQMTANKPVYSPKDLAGFKLRVPEQTVTVAYGKAMGANPTPIAYAEAYMALQQGVADGLENPLSAISSMKFYEVQDYIVLTSHVTNACFYVMNDAKYNSLSAEDQKILTDAFWEGSKEIVRLLDKDDRELISFFEEQGLEIITPDIDSFMEATASMPQDFAYWWEDEFGSDLHTRIQNIK
ncbi:MAG: sialic acid TRAP transporter substrate-binding protein SiaP [Sphaerochaetaceae bacterium]|nr:sialic acid TRAP transporter substrate-binding protein SiaP [Sphaerochaetaceae bacterium]